jgi:hypothetical protein
VMGVTHVEQDAVQTIAEGYTHSGLTKSHANTVRVCTYGNGM